MAESSLNGKKRKAPATAFKPGNAGGPGNPHAASMNKFRSRIFEKIESSPTGIDDAVDTLLALAKGGDVNAIKLLFQYAAGQPTQQVELDAKVNNVGPAVVIMPDWAGGDEKDFA